MGRLTTLKPRVQTLGRPLQAVVVERIRGRQSQRRRERVLSTDPLCAECRRQGLIVLAIEVDHVVPLWEGGAEDDANCEGLCVECHRAKSAAEAARRHGSNR